MQRKAVSLTPKYKDENSLRPLMTVMQFLTPSDANAFIAAGDRETEKAGILFIESQLAGYWALLNWPNKCVKVVALDEQKQAQTIGFGVLGQKNLTAWDQKNAGVTFGRIKQLLAEQKQTPSKSSEPELRSLVYSICMPNPEGRGINAAERNALVKQVVKANPSLGGFWNAAELKPQPSDTSIKINLSETLTRLSKAWIG